MKQVQSLTNGVLVSGCKPSFEDKFLWEKNYQVLYKLCDFVLKPYDMI